MTKAIIAKKPIFMENTVPAPKEARSLMKEKEGKDHCAGNKEGEDMRSIGIMENLLDGENADDVNASQGRKGSHRC